MRTKQKRRKSVLVRLLVLGVSVYMIVTLAGLWSTLNESRGKLNKLKTQFASEQAEVDELKTLLDDGSQAELIEKAARERLGYVYSDEEIYIDISGN